MKKYYRSKEIYTEAGIIDGYLVVENDKILDIINNDEKITDFFDYTNYKILPGIIDTHNHGTNGWSMLGEFASTDRKTEILGYLKALVSEGVTSVLPTATIDFFSSLADIKEEGFAEGAEILGIHSEGPWLNRVGEKGVRPANPYPPVELKVAEKMFNDARGYLKMVGMASEIPGINEIREYFKSKGVTIAVAHTDGNYQVTKDAIDNGVTVATHLCNVMTGIHHRDFGCLGACMTDKRVWAELICDGLHVCNEMLKFVYDVKGKDWIMMISDCTALSGMKPGYYQNDFLGGMIHVTESGFVLDENGRLRGSSKPVVYGMRNLVQNLNIPLSDVSQMTSYNPAKCHGFLSDKGSLKKHKDADFIVLDQDIMLQKTYVKGNCVYDIREKHDYFSPYMNELINKEKKEK